MSAKIESTPLAAMRLGDRPEDFRRFGLDPHAIGRWEDGLRTDPTCRGTYEWWYFDANLDDGAKLVVVFYTKPIIAAQGRLSPTVLINLALPDGTSVERTQTFPDASFSAATETCAVRIADNFLDGDLHTYRISAAINEVSVEVTLTGEVPAWRQKTSHLLFGPDGQEKDYFAWLPAVPQGSAMVTYRVGARSSTTGGIGYHDHNWGNVPMNTLMNDWYWGRAQVGPYTVIAAFITSSKRFGFSARTAFVLARDGAVVADDETKVRFEASDVTLDPATGKPVAGVISYNYRDGDQEFVIRFVRESTLVRAKFSSLLPPLKRLAARLTGFDGAYLRFAGSVAIDRIVLGTIAETYTAGAMWELMYFGPAHLPGQR